MSKIYFLLILFILITISCKQGYKNTSSDDPADLSAIIFTSNYPLYYFSERIGGELISLEFPASVSTDPAYWQPDPASISAMQMADLILLNGASYEKWLGKVSLPASRLYNTTDGLEDRFIPLEETVTHSHGPGGEHEHSGTAMTTWMDLTLALDQARSVKDALVSKFPHHNSEFEAAFGELEEELSRLDQDLQNITSNNPDLHVVFSHPVYQYFERRYKVKGISLHWEPDAMPAEEQWTELAHILDHHPNSSMVWEDEPLQEIASRLESMGIRILIFNPCGNLPESGDFLSIMKSNIEALRKLYVEIN
jgi:zinc transport system substrate-binding protein